MNHTIVHSQDDVKKHYYYKTSDPPVARSFPCIMVEDNYDVGLMGNQRVYSFAYPPSSATGLQKMYWMQGYIEGRKHL